jgi:hypothetical protein
VGFQGAGAPAAMIEIVHLDRCALSHVRERVAASGVLCMTLHGRAFGEAAREGREHARTLASGLPAAGTAGKAALEPVGIDGPSEARGLRLGRGLATRGAREFRKAGEAVGLAIGHARLASQRPNPESHYTDRNAGCGAACAAGHGLQKTLRRQASRAACRLRLYLALLIFSCVP